MKRLLLSLVLLSSVVFAETQTIAVTDHGLIKLSEQVNILIEDNWRISSIGSYSGVIRVVMVREVME